MDQTDKDEEEKTSLVQTSAQAFILAADPDDGWKPTHSQFASLIHDKPVKDGLKIILYNAEEKETHVFKWNPKRVKSKEDSRYLVLLVKPWGRPDDPDLTMTLKFHTDAGAQMWLSISEQMIDQLELASGGKKIRVTKDGNLMLHRATSAGVLEHSAAAVADEKEDDVAVKLEPGFYSIVSAKVDWVSFWSVLDESEAHRTLLPVNSTIEVTDPTTKKDSRGKMRTRAQVIELYYPEYSELHADEVPQKGSFGWIKGNYLAKRSSGKIPEDEYIDKKHYEDELLLMNTAFVEIEKLPDSDRIMLLRAIKVTLQHVIINPYRPRRLKKTNPKHSNIFRSDDGPGLLALVGFEVDGTDELFLPSAKAQVPLAKLILRKISELESVAPEDGAGGDAGQIIKLNVGGQTFLTRRETLLRIKNSWFYTHFATENKLPKVGDSYFIDRDPTSFKVVLEYLRDPHKVNLPTKRETLKDLYKEATYYGLADLLARVKGAHKNAS